AGVRTGARITKFAGQPIKVGHEVDRAIRKSAGQTVRVVLARPEVRHAGALLAAEVDTATIAEVFVPAGAQRMADLGWAPSGNFIRSVVPGGPADRAGLKVGDQIVAVGENRIRLFWSFLQAVETNEGEPLDVTVMRGGTEQVISLKASKVTCINDFTQKPYTLWDHGLG
ncbi:unnamed protein product, partial [Laminaria digitata]